MNRSLAVGAGIVVALGAGYLLMSGGTLGGDSQPSAASTAQSSPSGDTEKTGAANNTRYGRGSTGKTAPSEPQPAALVYANSADALAAIRAGAKSYDDDVLEQFTLPGEDCTWCAELYSALIPLMKSAESDEDEKAYYSEILAISGRPENVKALVDAIREAGPGDDADVYAESLELTLGGDDVVRYLSENLKDPNDLVQESTVAAITNQGSLLAAKTLYDHTVEQGDPDGYYSLGIGLGEMIPDEGTLPYLQELTIKRDPYSNLALKALLNYGHEGLVLVMDTLTNSPNPDFDRKMLEDAVDHVVFDDQTLEYVKEMANSKQPVVSEFAKEILSDYDDLSTDDDADDLLDDTDADDAE